MPATARRPDLGHLDVHFENIDNNFEPALVSIACIRDYRGGSHVLIYHGFSEIPGYSRYEYAIMHTYLKPRCGDLSQVWVDIAILTTFVVNQTPILANVLSYPKIFRSDHNEYSVLRKQS
jgi:hypothetical protein